MDYNVKTVDDYNIALPQGDTLAFSMLFDGLSQDLASADFSVKKSYSDNTYVIHKTIGNGITKVETGKYSVRVSPSDTSIDAGSYFYNLDVMIASDVFTLLRGMLTILDKA